MRRFRRHGARLRALTVATMTGIAAVLVLPTGPAAATPSCRGATCTGSLAADKGCVTGAFAIAGFQITDPTIADQPRGDLYYSPACQAAWGEYHTDPDLDGRMLTLYLQRKNGGRGERGVPHQRHRGREDDHDNDQLDGPLGQ